MPKKQPRNAFYFFMQNFREEQRKMGVMYNNLAEVATAAGPAWTSAPPQVRAKFDAMAKAEKAKTNVPERKYNSLGVPFSVIDAEEQERQDMERAELKDIQDFVTQSCVTNNLQNEDIYLIDVNCYCKTNTQYVIGEFAVLQFNLVDGIKEIYHMMVHPGGIPLGYALDTKLNCKELGLEVPDEDEEPSNYVEILSAIVDFLRLKRGNRNQPAPLYTMPDKVLPVLDFIHQLCNRAVEDETIFRVYRLDTLFYHMVSAAAAQRRQRRQCTEEEFPKPSLALAELKQDKFKYSPGIACDKHEERDSAAACCRARTKRWAYTLFDRLLPLYDLAPQPVKHLPPDYHLDTIVAVREERCGRGDGLPRARVAGAASDCSFSSDASFSCALPNRATESTKPEVKRTHTPLRKPNIDYSMAVRAPPIAESDFPRLGGRGRGRGLPPVDTFQNMKM